MAGAQDGKREAGTCRARAAGQGGVRLARWLGLPRIWSPALSDGETPPQHLSLEHKRENLNSRSVLRSPLNIRGPGEVPSELLPPPQEQFQGCGTGMVRTGSPASRQAPPHAGFAISMGNAPTGLWSSGRGMTSCVQSKLICFYSVL